MLGFLLAWNSVSHLATSSRQGRGIVIRTGTAAQVFNTECASTRQAVEHAGRLDGQTTAARRRKHGGASETRKLLSAYAVQPVGLQQHRR
jgi:hypothetical protein